MKHQADQSFSARRLLRFSGAGLVATATHLTVLTALSWSTMPLAISNALAFCTAFAVSMHLQQAITFADRLGGRRLNAIGLTCILLANLLAGGLAAHWTGKSWLALMLPLLPASVNYILLLLFSSRAWLPRVTTGNGS